MSRLVRKPDFSTLSIIDLLEARDAYHVHLANLEHVIATAIGKYLIRQVDPDSRDPARPLKKAGSKIRTLTNSVIKPWSWPCVLVFVEKWSTPSELAAHPEYYVPPRLYLPDGRIIPTCVVHATRETGPGAAVDDLQFAQGLIGGGYPVLSSVQGEDRIGSLGCLVTDGHSVFALTNRHVAGPKGLESFTVADGNREKIGISDSKSAGKVGFSDAYPGWPGYRTNVNLDAGLIRVENLSAWTAQVFGIGEMGELVDANVDTLTLDFVDTPVRAFGGASGELRGVIKAMFYRYRSVGGADYITDFLIGPRDARSGLRTRPGDSGTIWFWDAKADSRTRPLPEPATKAAQPRPLAMQWGGHSLRAPGGNEAMQFALAASLATVCRTLDLEIIADWDVGHSEYWGKVGHYKVAAKACDVVANPKLYELMQANIDRVALTDPTIESGALPMANQPEFVALADVPDLVWRRQRGKDKANHFANLDLEGVGRYDGKTLMDLWEEDPSNLNPAVWTEFYDDLGVDRDAHRGALPFRVRQIYEEMVRAVRRRSLSRYVAAAGILAHYVADACQPLHISRLHHGREDRPSEAPVHTIFETKLLDRYRVEMIAGVNEQLNGLEIASRFRGGQTAASATMDLAKFTLETLPPDEVVAAYNAREGRERIPHMWSVLGRRTITCMAEGVLYLAEMWESAWIEGGGNQIPNSRLRGQNKTTLRNLYNNYNFIRSDWLKDMSF